MKHDYDIAIIGGGLVGASLALALTSVRGTRLKVALIETYPLKMDDTKSNPSYQPSYDARSTALAWGTRLIYEDLKLWETLKLHVTPIKHIHVSDKGRFGATRLHGEDYQQEALGYVVENQWVGQCLLEKVADCADIDLICPDEVEALDTSAEGARLSLKHRGAISASVAVLADGGRSGLREKLGISVTSHDYQQTAIIANVTASKHHAWVAYERFTESGPMALLPLGELGSADARCALVWTLPSAEADQVLQQSDTVFLERLQKTFGYRVGKFTRAGQRFSYPLVLTLSNEQVRPGLVVVGNAAHTLHPVAGQGYNLALRGVMRLAAAILQAKNAGKPLAQFEVLSGYLQAQDADRGVTVSFSNFLMQLFSTQNSYLGALLGVGLAGLDVIPAAKGRLSEQAMGLAQAKAVL